MNTHFYCFLKRLVDNNLIWYLIILLDSRVKIALFRIYMYQHRGIDKEFDVVDIDPYGSASVFLDAAVQSVKNGGKLYV